MRALALFAILTASLGAQSLPQVGSFVESSALGSPRIWNIGDIDGDGLDDTGVTATGLTSQGSGPELEVTSYVVKSTTNSATILTQPSGVSTFPRFAFSFFPIADRDGDSVDDLVAYFPREGGPFGSTPASDSLRFYSGLTLTEVGSVVLPLGDGFTGFTTAGDRNMDGIEDFIMTYYSNGGLFVSPQNHVEIIDGATFNRTTLLSFDASLEAGGIVRVGDINGDGVDEFVSGSQHWFEPFAASGSTTVFSGIDGFAIGHLAGQSAGNRLGTRIVSAGDLNGDGIIEVASLASGFSNGQGRVRIIDPTTATVIRDLNLSQFPTTSANAILNLLAAGDHDGDGIQDLAVVLGTGAVPGVTSAMPEEIHWVRGSDGSPFHMADFESLTHLTAPPSNATSSWPIGDVNGDGIADVGRALLSQSTAAARVIEMFTMIGAQSYGTGSPGRSLNYSPGISVPAQGSLRLNGAQPFAPLVGALSLAPADTNIFGTTFPLLISAAAQDLILVTNEMANGLGSLTVPIDLSLPFLNGLTLYVQYAETGSNPGTSNAVALHFGPIP